MKKVFVLSAINGLCAVGLGALGAHALRDTLVRHETVSAWHTAASYHLAHAILAQAAVWIAQIHPAAERRIRLPLYLWLVGTLFFSGSLYLLSLGGPRVLGPITPLGGLLLMAGWAAAARALIPAKPPA